ncbi:MAG: nickel pincer cofactor biosynthesis protein LarC [Candidatus Aminicenantes bacterium]|nr:nickel pincer cofactor biosynthesis protein LarC [Candidatus Aminicenantes bacterium]
MRYVYLQATAGLSGDMILAALLDLGVPPATFRRRLAALKLPVRIGIRDVRRGGLRGLKVDVEVRRHGHGRTWDDVSSLIRGARLSPAVRDGSLAVFKRLFEAEAKVHGRAFRKTHLHEAGADDALVDIVGACLLLEELEVGALYCSPLNVGSGWVETSHGVLPVPPPAVAELLKDAPVYSAHASAELVTPTGAAVVTSLAKAFLPFPELVYDRIGYGAGGRELPELANILRAYAGDLSRFKPRKQVYVVEAALDDANPQLLAYFLEEALRRGALDANLSPVVMKKNRLGTKLTLIVPADKLEDLIAAVFKETTTIGVRYFPVERRVLERDVGRVRTGGAEIAVKVSRLEGRPVSVQPEYDDCAKAARAAGRPLKDVMRDALKAYESAPATPRRRRG